MSQRDLARCRCAGLVCLCLAVGVGAAGAARAATPAGASRAHATGGPCAFAHATPSGASARHLGAALRCLVNRERRRRGLARLIDARRLGRMAQDFAADMRTRGYFAHISPDGRGPADRLRSARLRAIGEVLAWGCGTLSTPAATVRAWLASPPHRRLVLSHAYTVFGAGAVAGAPGQECGPAASTSVVLLGRR